MLHPFADLAKAKPVYTALLGIAPQHDAPYYVGFDVAGQHIGLVPAGGGMPPPVAYWHVPDIEAKLADVVAAGGTEHHQAVMAHADWIIDLGPGAGHDGGRIVFEGTPADLIAARSTLTGEHLAAYVGT